MKYRLEIPEPCNEDWDLMTPQEKGRHCAVCDKVVVDFSKATKQEVYTYIGKNKQTCGVVPTHLLQTTFEVEKRKKAFGLHGLVATVVNLLALTSTVHVSGQERNETTAIEKSNISGQQAGVGIGTELPPIQGMLAIVEPAKRKIKIQVVSQYKKPIADVVITIEQTVLRVTTDAKGMSEFEIPENTDTTKLCIQFVKNGFIKIEVPFPKEGDELLVVLEEYQVIKGDIVLKR